MECILIAWLSFRNKQKIIGRKIWDNMQSRACQLQWCLYYNTKLPEHAVSAQSRAPPPYGMEAFGCPRVQEEFSMSLVKSECVVLTEMLQLGWADMSSGSAGTSRMRWEILPSRAPSCIHRGKSRESQQGDS